MIREHTLAKPTLIKKIKLPVQTENFNQNKISDSSCYRCNVKEINVQLKCNNYNYYTYNSGV